MSLALKIERAFGHTMCPGADDLFEGDSEGAETVFLGRKWRELEDAELDYHVHVLHVFSPAAFAYYLPAFMRAATANETLGLVDPLIDCLCPPKNNPARPSFARRWSLLTSEQRGVVVAFLRHFATRNPIAIREAASALDNGNA